ncbi:DUF6841 family protein [Geodermatophilus amargosae]|uniref:DUF6841 family protein n=1 Tax=Geodermatophilus amargosae TaxID=1296565 RepID=UPI0034DE6930
MDEHEITRWYRAYLADFVALARGDSDDVRRLLAHYGVPLIVSTDAGCSHLTDEDQVLALARRLVSGLRASGYDRGEELSSATVVLNGTCALHRAAFARLRADGTEITRVETTYLITDGPAGRRISALLAHSGA